MGTMVSLALEGLSPGLGGAQIDDTQVVPGWPGFSIKAVNDLELSSCYCIIKESDPHDMVIHEGGSGS